MVRHTRKTKLISLFVLAFVCLNAVGAACVAYCRAVEIPEVTAQKSSHHCELALGAELEDSSPSIGKNLAAKPCPMILSFFGGPVEKHQAPVAKAIATSTRPVDGFRSVDPTIDSLPTTFSYRGPPLLDRRVERIKHRLLLI
jgi:hypothetical protein